MRKKSRIFWQNGVHVYSDAGHVHLCQQSIAPSLHVHIDNHMADMVSCTFHHNMATSKTFNIDDNAFLHLFASTFPLQNGFWHIFYLSSKLIS